MEKTEFQKFAYSELSKLFLKLFLQGKARKYSSEAKGDRQKIKYEPHQGSLSIYFTGAAQYTSIKEAILPNARIMCITNGKKHLITRTL